MLSCKDLVRLISDYAGGEIDSLLKDEFEAHLAGCHKCRVMVRTMQQTILLCKGLDPIQMPPGVHKKLRITIKERWQRKHVSLPTPPYKRGAKTRPQLGGMATRRHQRLLERARIDDAVDRLFRRSLLGLLPGGRRRGEPSETVWTPAVDLLDRKSYLLLRADLPGTRKEDVKVTIWKGRRLTITGEIIMSAQEKKEDYYRRERYSGRFTRTVQLPTEVVADKVEATLWDGILELILPKKEAKKTRNLRIEVK